MTIQAKTKKQAEKQAKELVEEIGIDAIKNFDITHREVNIIN